MGGTNAVGTRRGTGARGGGGGETACAGVREVPESNARRDDHQGGGGGAGITRRTKISWRTWTSSPRARGDLEERWRSAECCGASVTAETLADKRWAARGERGGGDARDGGATEGNGNGDGRGSAREVPSAGRGGTPVRSRVAAGRRRRRRRRRRSPRRRTRASGRVGVGSVPTLAWPASGGARARTNARPPFK